MQELPRLLTGCGCAYRTSGEGECEASEGSFMCEDMLRAGYQRFIVDPGTRQAYFPETAKKLYTDQVHVNIHWAKLMLASGHTWCNTD